MARRIVIDPALHDLDDWPLVAFSTLPDTQRQEYLRREEALRKYLSGDSLADIEELTGIARQQLYNLLRRCLTRHKDGRIYGFRGLLRYERVKTYDRQQPVNAVAESRRSGAAGAMSQLLKRHASLGQLIREQIDGAMVRLTPAGHIRGLRGLHRSFIARCVVLGITEQMYPLNQLHRGKRSLALVAKAMLNETFARAAYASGAGRIGAPWHETESASVPPAIIPFQVVEFDGHKLDIRLRVRLIDPFDIPYDLELERVWFLAIIDVASRAILGWNVVLAPEYDRYDVIRTLQAALQPRHRRSAFSISGLGYAPDAGFVSQTAPCYSFAAWQWLRLDNARANLADDTLNALTEVIGCFVDAGPVAQPNERPYIERFFRTIAESVSHRLPGYTGNAPGDVRRQLSDPGGDTSLLVTFEELEELCDVTIANYNGTVHSSLGGGSPLEFLMRWARQHGPQLRQLSDFQRRRLYMIQPPYRCMIRGNKSTGGRVDSSGQRNTYRLLFGWGDLGRDGCVQALDREGKRHHMAWLAQGPDP